MGQRGHGRADTDVSVTLTLANGIARRVDRLRNISLGGLFIEMDEPLPFGSEVDLEFVLAAGVKAIQCRGLVVRRQTNTPTGIGLRLLEIEPSDLRLVADYLEQHLVSA
ncbi:MAG: PilZ domain-containing protein [Myxococcota bacterium]